MKDKIFFRMYGTRKKFNYLLETTSKRNHITRDLPSCLTEKFNGFHIVRIEAENEIRVLYPPIDTKHFKIKINCLFSTDKCLATFGISIYKSKNANHKVRLNYHEKLNFEISNPSWGNLS